MLESFHLPDTIAPGRENMRTLGRGREYLPDVKASMLGTSTASALQEPSLATTYVEGSNDYRWPVSTSVEH